MSKEELTLKKLVVTEGITIKHPEATRGITIQATPEGAGIWVGEGMNFVAIHFIDNQCCLALATNKDKNGHAFAVFIDLATGEPGIQLSRPGKEPVMISGDKLERLLEG